MNLILDPLPPGAQPVFRALWRANMGLSSRAIEWWGAGGWSHVDIVLSTGWLLGARSDAVGGRVPGVQIRPPDYEIPTRWQLLELPVTIRQYETGMAWLAEQIGKPYDHVGILDFALGRIRRRVWLQATDWWCSETLGALLINSGVVPAEAANASCMIDPGTAMWMFRGAGAREAHWQPPSAPIPA